MREKLFHRDFTLVVIGQIISLLGNAVLRFVLPLYLLDVTGSRSLFGLCSAAAFVPMVVLTPLGGVVADRLHKQRIMVVLDFFTCCPGGPDGAGLGTSAPGAGAGGGHDVAVWYLRGIPAGGAGQHAPAVPAGPAGGR